jgi:hypothetical protein
MIDRRRENMTLSALEALIQFLQGAREGRKAIVAITDGWLLYQANQGLMRQADDRPPAMPPLNVDPRNGRLTTKDTTTAGAGTRSECEQQRVSLSQLNDDFRFNLMLDQANRANASFYPVDPRGLTAFDTPIGPDPPAPAAVDRAQLRQRSIALRTLASATDGTAVVGTNNIGPALTRIVADLSSYYLLGYYSTNTRLDGKFRSLTVKVSRPGLQVRARRGYLAATAADVASRAPANPIASGGPAAADAAALATVVGSLARFAREAPLRLQAASAWTAAGATTVWVVGEIGAGETWAGGEANVTLLRDATPISTARATVSPPSRTFRIALTPGEPLPPGQYQLRVRARSAAGSGAPLDEIVGLVVAAAPDSTGALVIRRGPSTANKAIPTADLRFRRNERLGIDLPAAPSPPTVRVLDRTGKPIPIPVAVTARDDPDGSAWLSGEIALAPLAPGDYVVEATLETRGELRRTLMPFRIVP